MLLFHGLSLGSRKKKKRLSMWQAHRRTKLLLFSMSLCIAVLLRLWILSPVCLFQCIWTRMWCNSSIGSCSPGKHCIVLWKAAFFIPDVLCFFAITSVLVIGGLDIIVTSICRRGGLWHFSKSNSLGCCSLSGF